ncbi:MAG TPA: YtxH domain-containing protein [Gemmatimonadales bacterium]
MADDYTSDNGGPAGERGGFVALAIIAAAVGAGAALLLAPETGAKTRKRVGQGLRSFRGEASETIGQLQREVRRKRHQSRRENRLMGLAGLLIGAGLAAVLTPTSGPATRQRLGSTWNRIKVGTVDRIDRLRARRESSEPGIQPDSVRTVQELGRDPNAVF